jgi:hypothetical protein
MEWQLFFSTEAGEPERWILFVVERLKQRLCGRDLIVSIKKLAPKPTSEWLRALDFRVINLRYYTDALEALASAGEQILRGCLESHLSANRRSIRRIMASWIIASLVSVRAS